VASASIPFRSREAAFTPDPVLGGEQ
jgi:hypothetical protein